MLSLEKIRKAAQVLESYVWKTDLIYAPKLGENNDIYLKVENLQVTGSFKARGACYKMSLLTKEQRDRGVIACSAGNHAQGVALAAQRLGINATIFIPSTAPISKIEATRRYGVEVRLIDGVYDDAYEEAVKYQEKTGGLFVHPFDDEDVIAGQGTIGLELIEQLPDIDAVVVPVGGGGLVAGIAYVIKQLKPDCKVYGVQACGAGGMYASFENNRRTQLPTVKTFADGIAVKLPGEITFDLSSKYVDDIVTVSDDEIAAAILRLLEVQKLIAEGAGAVSIAALMFNKIPLKSQKIAAVISGGNIDVNILSRVINRGLLSSGRLSDLTLELIDKPGQLKEVSHIIANLGANVIKVSHNWGGENTDINDCYLKVSMETRNHQHFNDIKAALIGAGYKIVN